MMGKLTAKNDGSRKSSLNQRYFQVKEEDRQEMFMTDTIMIREIIIIGIDQIVKVEEFHLVVEFSVVKIIETDKGRGKVIGMTLEEIILKIMWECIRIRTIEDRIIEVDIDETIGMRTMKEVRVGLEKGNIKVI